MSPTFCDIFDDVFGTTTLHISIYKNTTNICFRHPVFQSQLSRKSKLQSMVDEVKLFGFWSSPFSRRVEMALKLKGVKYEYFEEDIANFNKSSALLHYNPIHKKVPVLIHNGNPIAESSIILEYIDETWNASYPLRPLDPYARADSRFWTDFIANTVRMHSSILFQTTSFCTMQSLQCKI